MRSRAGEASGRTERAEPLVPEVDPRGRPWDIAAAVLFVVLGVLGGAAAVVLFTGGGSLAAALLTLILTAVVTIVAVRLLTQVPWARRAALGVCLVMVVTGTIRLLLGLLAGAVVLPIEAIAAAVLLAVAPSRGVTPAAPPGQKSAADLMVALYALTTIASWFVPGV